MQAAELTKVAVPNSGKTLDLAAEFGASKNGNNEQFIEEGEGEITVKSILFPKANIFYLPLTYFG